MSSLVGIVLLAILLERGMFYKQLTLTSSLTEQLLNGIFMFKEGRGL